MISPIILVCGNNFLCNEYLYSDLSSHPLPWCKQSSEYPRKKIFQQPNLSS
ncbi:hypothetical protein KsCSTR_12450 [Candidatus Kuenenia stuttgartiensis]|uniref:Uncharacterized protein n=1 Tax=Kuenenia stuttgartiensis TaxID=174633 RepID=Q1Q0H3_KUEST|nr:hypothetical protein KsCSTR_12450 [Candidatus Kuenenia stuttgartiensis]CAJ72028.1 unknown protein [Candidatus Kuenenia stuttgartiensis]